MQGERARLSEHHVGWMSIGLEWTLAAASRGVHMAHRRVAAKAQPPPVGQLQTSVGEDESTNQRSATGERLQIHSAARD